MLVRSFPAQLWGTNCHIVASRDGEHAVVIDPGYDVVDGVAEVVAEHRLRPVAIMLTHGHLDHTWSILPLSGNYDAACWIHPGDRPQLADPGAWLSPGTSEMLAEMGAEFAEPDDVRDLADGIGVDVAGLRFEVDHTPGHSLGSVLFRIDDPAAGERLVFSGDTLFAGSIGRTDLPGADAGQMRHSLTTKVLPLADATIVLPGHGPNTTIAVERATNPYLRPTFLLGLPDLADGSRA
ncbi:MAG TPA: MBL fold metallo-hydrolase [Actinopolymorphaceae bacterium]|jgi:glyoxylase-like metal-dependent hydrolase (beta-lactamase superfamily II)